LGVFYYHSFTIFNKGLNIKTIIQKTDLLGRFFFWWEWVDSLGTVRLRGIPDDFVSLRLQNLLFVEPVVLISPHLAQNKNRPYLVGIFWWEWVDSLGYSPAGHS